MEKKRGTHAWTALLVVALVMLILTFSIALPIYVRPFYYAHVGALGLPERTGHSAADIRAAYDEVLDYLTLPGRDFGTGIFAHSEEGKSHFEDCKVLFDLNAVVLCISLLTAALIGILHRRRVISLARPRGMAPTALAGALTLVLVTVLGLAVAVDFDSAFVVFHRVLFPGKENWLFNPLTDGIIEILPAQFFMNCAILIGASVLLCSVGLVVHGLLTRDGRLKDRM